MRRFGRFLRNVGYLAAPYFRSEEKWSAWGLLLLVLVADFALVRINVLVNLNGGAWVNALQQYDSVTFFHLLLSYEPSEDGPFGIIPGFVPLVAVALLIWVNGRYMRQWLQIRMRRWLTAYYQDRWLADRAYYQMQLQPETLGNDNPDQRISEDIANFVESALILGFGLLTNIVSLVSFLQILYMLSFPVSVFGFKIPAYLVWVAFGYSVIGTLLAQLIGRPLVSLNFIRQRLEADYRFALVRLRENAEGVALYAGEADEGQILSRRFSAIVANFRRIMSRNRLVNAFTYSYGQVAGIIPFLAASPLYFAKEISFGTLSRVAGAFGEVQSSASWIVDNYMGLADWASTVERLATFGRSLDAMRAQRGTGIAQVIGTGETFEIRDLHVQLPNQATLLEHTNLTLAPGSSTVLSGRSGTGKIDPVPRPGRHLAVWQRHGGAAGRARPCSCRRSPISPLGTLRRAVTYPGGDGCVSPSRRSPPRCRDAGTRRPGAGTGRGHVLGPAPVGRRTAAPGLGPRPAHQARLAVPGRSHRQPGPGGGGGAVPPAPRTAAHHHPAFHRPPAGRRCPAPGPSGVAKRPGRRRDRTGAAARSGVSLGDTS